MSTKYTKAPISELIFGVIFNTPLLLNNGVIFELIIDLAKKGFPNSKTFPAIFEEDWRDNKLSVNMDYERAGFSLYRLYSKEGDYLVQLQPNLILLNWIRKDDTAVGKYPGFAEVFSKFNSVISLAKDKLSIDNDTFQKEVKNLTLTYNDRVSIESYKDDEALNKILNMTFPSVPSAGENIYPSMIISKMISRCPTVNGYDSLSINSGHDQQGKRILAIENRIKGGLNKDITVWFDEAHNLQVQFFEKLFTKEILKEWQ